jgi:putative addiction module component (TIGR02574 family)
MTKETLLAEILRLPVEEQIDLLGDAWDAIAASPADIPIPRWHLDELERRLAEPSAGYVTWKEVQDRLKASS